MPTLIALAAACAAEDTLQLPPPEDGSGMTLEEAVDSRRSVRSYSDDPVTLPQLSGILHSAQGITSERGYRAAPSAGATYPMTIHVVAERVDGLRPGIYVYRPERSTLETLMTGTFLDDLAGAALGQSCITDAALAVVILADYSVTTDVYGERGIRYVHMEAGHVSQNIYLRATAMGLGTVAVGAFSDDEAAALLGVEDSLAPLYIMPVGSL
ncbi:MAG: SagB/ThcOx family dehydrogenase [Candidatus Aegiribacteria sp.]